jgi:hypothetical protein
MLLLAKPLLKMCQNMALNIKAVAKNIWENFNRNVGETEPPLLYHLHYAGASAHCSN